MDWKTISRNVSLTLLLVLSVLVTGGGADTLSDCGDELCDGITEDGENPMNVVAAALLGWDCRTALPFHNSPVKAIRFEWNVGQASSAHPVLARGPGYFLFLSGSEATFDLRDKSRSPAGLLRMRLAGASSAGRVEPEDSLGQSNYFLGSDPAKWLTDVPTFRRVRFRDVYPGIDAVYYTRDSELEHDFVVRPGADPRKIRLRFDGADRVGMQADGSLEVSLGGRTLRWNKPLVYQEIGGRRQAVDADYQLDAEGGARFAVAQYDRGKTLVIDPVVSYSTFLGRTSMDFSTRVAADASGNVFLTGMSDDPNFPVTPGAFTALSVAQGNATVVKLDSTGSNVVFSTHIGGTALEAVTGIAVDRSGAIYLAGSTSSRNYPTTAGVIRPEYTPGGLSGDPTQCFVTKLNSAGNALVYSTYLGGSAADLCTGLAVDDSGNAYLTGATQSTNFPITEAAPQRIVRGGFDGFVTKLNPTATALVHSTFFGGTGIDFGTHIAVDSQGNAYITGATASPLGFPVSNGSFQTRFGGVNPALGDAFVLKLNAAGTAWTYGSYLGGSRDEIGLGIAVDAQGNAYVTGATGSVDYPVTAGAYQSANRGAGGTPPPNEGFVAKVNPTGSALVYSTYLGGTQADVPMAIGVDSAGNATVAGFTLSTNYPVSNDATQSRYGGTNPESILPTVGDAFITQLNPGGSALRFSTYVGGSSSDWALGLFVEPQGNFYVAGSTGSQNFPVSEAGAQRQFGGGPAFAIGFGDTFVVKYLEAASGAPSISAVASAASYAGGSAAPGEILVLT